MPADDGSAAYYCAKCNGARVFYAIPLSSFFLFAPYIFFLPLSFFCGGKLFKSVQMSCFHFSPLWVEIESDPGWPSSINRGKLRQVHNPDPSNVTAAPNDSLMREIWPSWNLSLALVKNNRGVTTQTRGLIKRLYVFPRTNNRRAWPGYMPNVPRMEPVTRSGFCGCRGSEREQWWGVWSGKRVTWKHGRCRWGCQGYYFTLHNKGWKKTIFVIMSFSVSNYM